jgi:hypothetical protein
MEPGIFQIGLLTFAALQTIYYQKKLPGTVASHFRASGGRRRLVHGILLPHLALDLHSAGSGDLVPTPCPVWRAATTND